MLHSIGGPDRAEREHQSLSEALKKVKKYHRDRKKGHFLGVIAVVLENISSRYLSCPVVPRDGNTLGICYPWF